MQTRHRVERTHRHRAPVEKPPCSTAKGAAAGETTPVRILISSTADVLYARKAARVLALEAGFRDAAVTSVVTALSEITRNIVEYAHCGEVLIRQIQRGAQRGLEVTATDQGPGIRDAQSIMEHGNSRCAGMGTGLTRAKWLMDEFEIRSKPKAGTVVKMVKWLA